MNFNTVIITISWLLLLVLGIKISIFCISSYKHYKTVYFRIDNNYQPFVSIIVPCFNEALTLSNCIKSLINQKYTNFEIVIVDDGSTDNTKEVGQQLSLVYAEKVKLLSKANGGKACALNYGIKHSSGEIIISMDADSIFLNDTLQNLVSTFKGNDVVAVSGNVKISNREKFLNKHQNIEYISGQNIQRRAFAYIGCMQVISGTIGAFRREKLLEIGGYSSDTIVEDMDVTIELAKRGYRIEFNGNAIAYTEAPENIKDFVKQRYRWVYGCFQVINKHREILFSKKFGRIGTIGLPYCLIFPWVDVIISILFIYILIQTLIYGHPFGLLFFYILMFLIQAGVLCYALHIDKEKKSLSLLSFIETLWYPHLINFVTIIAGVSYMRGSKISWNKMPRMGKNLFPEG